MRVLAAALLAILAALSGAPLADEAVPTAQDPVAAKRSVELSRKLRCLVCQNQSIAESNADLAVDLRRQIDEQIAAGKTDAEIVAFMTDRYGDFVLYQPPFKTTTVLLWAGPALLLLVGLVALRRALRRQAEAPADAPLTERQRALAARLLREQTAPGSKEPR
ncbi:MAG: cytochrome c-type biogenesis protein [Gammaproteobacteria bacterium]